MVIARRRGGSLDPPCRVSKQITKPPLNLSGITRRCAPQKRTGVDIARRRPEVDVVRDVEALEQHLQSFITNANGLGDTHIDRYGSSFRSVGSSDGRLSDARRPSIAARDSSTRSRPTVIGIPDGKSPVL